ncbi:NAD(P)-dependent oxidoreductase [Pleomorphomonas diazotrophica]|uniref:NAD(P)-dependent oxidoreductase n=1 Tax=Pleomorphomonas diazotrophica TaxID=1166257 RepID=A0A1I4QW17_9HYPH|nr:NmrA family NAD(P)-binding protein [Pleomorphomonas diazotrophica]PKR90389.1 NAD(P)-dependent oxidoreductase [Pleomorphomonas diazotrophica]SFM44187.1 NAD(P)H dehydrogenase (quinone) [Pleomorphomonas diazotrophica]
MSEKLMVTGATGKLGRSVVNLLLGEFGIAPADLVAGTRDPGKLSDLSTRGVTVRAVDFDKPETLPAAFAGIDRLLIVSTDAIGVRLAGQQAAVKAAKAAGVKGLVYTSAPNPHGDNHPLSFAGDHAGTETAIFDSGLPYRILRNNWYQENLAMSLPAVLKSGTWYTSEEPGTKVAYVAHEDCARAAAAALIRPWKDDRAIYEITGAEALTIEELAALASEKLAKPINVVHLSPEALASGLKAANLPPPVIEMLLSLDATNSAGLLAKTSGAVEELTGRKPSPIASYLEANRAALTA